MSDAALRGLQGAMGRAQKLQEELSSGRRVNRPGDDPAAAAASMKLRSQKRADEQYLRNIEDSSGRLEVTDDSLVQISSLVRRARELVVSVRNGTLGEPSRAAIAQEIDAIRQDVVDQFNTRWLDRPVFGGTTPGDVAIDESGAYVGDDVPVESRINRDAVIRMDVAGSAVGADSLPGVLAQAVEDVTGPPEALDAVLDGLDEGLQKVLRGLGDVGARAARLETVKQSITGEKLDFAARISENEEIDLPETIVRLESQKVAYEAALGAMSKVVQVSLMDFLR
jgi:flagellar hook-associated protein 3 FlgL